MTIAQSLGQADLTASLADVYTCPTGKTATVYVEVCNRSAVAATVRVTLSPLGAVDAVTHSLRHDLSVAANSFMQRVAVTMAATDVIRGSSGTANVLTMTVNGLLQDA